EVVALQAQPHRVDDGVGRHRDHEDRGGSHQPQTQSAFGLLPFRDLLLRRDFRLFGPVRLHGFGRHGISPSELTALRTCSASSSTVRGGSMSPTGFSVSVIRVEMLWYAGDTGR